MEIVFEHGKVWGNHKISFAKVDKNGDLKNGVKVEMNQFNLVVVKKDAEEIVDQESKSALEEGGKHHDFVGVGCWNVLTVGRAPLQHLTVREKVARDELTDLAFIGDCWLQQVWVWGAHGKGRRLR
jgi:hypothetical protein